MQSVVKINISDSKINLSQTWGQALRYSFVFCLFSDAVSDTFDIYRHKTRIHFSRMRTARSRSRLLGGEGFCLTACWDTPHGCGPGDPPARPLNLPPGCGPGHPLKARPLNFPPGCGPGDPPQPDPSTSPLGVDLETCKTCWDTTLPLWTE